MKNNSEAPKRPRGRPRTFDRDAALEKAMLLFWERGFEGTSMDELTAAMGMSPSSLYSAFGGKEQLYREAVDRYDKGPGAYGGPILAATKTAR
jgi:TetR/AcrR family transcriptional regulator, copper-responsive repressor